MRQTSNLVSVIIPYYNHGKYLHEAIDSILNQTYQNFEIIVVDDGSNDKETLDILARIDNPRVVVYHKKNGDVASARNFGIKRCRGEYILTLDADDKFAPTFIEKGVNILKKNPEVGMVTSYIQRFGPAEKGKTHSQGGGLKDFLLKNNAVSCLLFRYECWLDSGGYDDEIAGFEDWEFAIRVTKLGWTVHSIPEYLFFYRRVEGSMYSRVMEKRPEIMNYIVNKHQDVFKYYIADVIYDKELQIKELKKTVEMYRNSRIVKIGSLFMAPTKWIKNFKLSWSNQTRSPEYSRVREEHMKS